MTQRKWFPFTMEQNSLLKSLSLFNDKFHQDHFISVKIALTWILERSLLLAWHGYYCTKLFHLVNKHGMYRSEHGILKMNYVQRTEINQWRTLSFFSLPEDPSLKSSHTFSWKRHKRTRMGSVKTLVFRGCSRNPKSRHDSVLVKIIVNDCYSTLSDIL